MSMRRAKYKFYRTAAPCAVCETILDHYNYSTSDTYLQYSLESSYLEFLCGAVGAVIDAQVRFDASSQLSTALIDFNQHDKN